MLVTTCMDVFGMDLKIDGSQTVLGTYLEEERKQEALKILEQEEERKFNIDMKGDSLEETRKIWRRMNLKRCVLERQTCCRMPQKGFWIEMRIL